MQYYSFRHFKELIRYIYIGIKFNDIIDNSECM